MDTPFSNEQLSTFHEQGRVLLLGQTRALNAVIHDLHILDEEKTAAAVWMPALMLQAVGVSTHSILALTRERDMAIRDCFGIARSAVETALNAAYIAVEGPTAADLALRHMRQKRWRDLNRQGQFGDLKFSVWRDIGVSSSAFAGLEGALAEFTTKKGREITSWTSVSIEDRVRSVSAESQSAGIALGSAVFGIYRPASELLHGSYYGVNHFWQGSRETPARDRHSFDTLWVMEHYVTLLSTVFLAILGSIKGIAAVFRLKGHAELQDNQSRQLEHLIEAMSAQDPDEQHHFSAS